MEFCTRGHSQEPKYGAMTVGVDENGKMTRVKTIISGPREDRKGRCHVCGAPVMPPQQEV